MHIPLYPTLIELKEGMTVRSMYYMRNWRCSILSAIARCLVGSMGHVSRAGTSNGLEERGEQHKIGHEFGIWRANMYLHRK